MNDLVLTARISDTYITIHVGPWDADTNDLRFGWDAELSIAVDHWSTGLEPAFNVGVNFASIGTLPPRAALARSESYRSAARLGEFLDDRLEGNYGWGFGEVAEMLKDTDGMFTNFDLRVGAVNDYRGPRRHHQTRRQLRRVPGRQVGVEQEDAS